MQYCSWPPDASTVGVHLLFELILGLGLASQMSFLRKTKKDTLWLFTGLVVSMVGSIITEIYIFFNILPENLQVVGAT